MTESIRSISVVIPVLNEEGSLPTLLEELKAVAGRLSHLSFEWLFIDDGSTDNSPELIRSFAKADQRVKGIIFRRNYGQTAAMSCGIQAATGDIIIPMDADLQNDPADIPMFIEKINEGYSCVSGWRKQRQDGFVLRLLPSWSANWIISVMTGVKLHDYGCSMKAYRRSIIQDVELYGEMHRFIPAYAAWSGAKVTEIVVNHRARKFGVSKYGISRVFKVILDLIVVKFLTNYFNKPIHFFGAVGLASLAIGSVALLGALTYKILGVAFVSTPLPTVGAMFVIVGVQFILFGLLSEVLMRTYYGSRNTRPYSIREAVNIVI
ncbi:glycosyltransferase family 2 protein [Patescibacteria group bacterium]|jgi:glycosyltransferase involved in cell wall biosynthesis|nr:glycosyltransferase family 2 protein [Patescibacteria group bacterium]